MKESNSVMCGSMMNDQRLSFALLMSVTARIEVYSSNMVNHSSYVDREVVYHFMPYWCLYVRSGRESHWQTGPNTNITVYSS